MEKSKSKHKLQPKSQKIILGYEDRSKSVRYYDACTRTVKVSQNFAFNENEEPREWKEPANMPGL